MGALERLVADLMIQARIAEKEMEADLEGNIKIRAIHCPHCGTNSDSMEAATAHDGQCEKHPMAAQLAAKDARIAELDAGIAKFRAYLDNYSDVEDIPDNGGVRPNWAMRCEMELDAALSGKGESRG